MARPAAGGLDGRVVSRALHELPGILQRRGAGRSPHGSLPASGLPPQRLPGPGHGPRSA